MALLRTLRGIYGRTGYPSLLITTVPMRSVQHAGIKTIIRFSIDNNGTKTILAVSRDLFFARTRRQADGNALIGSPLCPFSQLRVSAIDTRHLQSLNRLTGKIKILEGHVV